MNEKIPICPDCGKLMSKSVYSYDWYCPKCIDKDYKKEGAEGGYSY